jgi:chromosome segregation ATPase
VSPNINAVMNNVTTPMDIEKPSTVSSVFSAQRPLVISLPPANSPSTASRGVSVAVEKLFEAFLEALNREETVVRERMTRLQNTLGGLGSKVMALRDEVVSLNADIERIQADLVHLAFVKQKLVAVSVIDDDDLQIRNEIDVIEVKIMALKENLATLTLARDISMKHGFDVETQINSFSVTIDQSKVTFHTVQGVKAEFLAKKTDVDSVKQKVDERYKDILVTFARKNELELKRIMDPALDSKEALELLSTRLKCENELFGKVAAFIELRTSWNNCRTALAQYVHANKSKVVGIAA